MMNLTSSGTPGPRASDGGVGTAGDLWLTDTVPSERFPLYTRLNANDVLPDPVTPLGATLAWIPNILPGWVAGYVALGAFAPEEFGSEAVAPNAGFLRASVCQSDDGPDHGDPVRDRLAGDRLRVLRLGRAAAS
jgi:hypothetical protein